MKRICLGCREVVIKNINENYRGMTIHYGLDWYCGPVVDVEDSVIDETMKFLQSEHEEKSYLLDVVDFAALEADNEVSS